MDRANTGTATPSSMAVPDPADACLAAPFGMPVELLPNLYLVRVPLPHNPLRALNSYLILSKDRTTIVDVGFNHPACEEALGQALAALGRTWDGVEIVLTHSHPDHTGNLDRIYPTACRSSRTSTRSKRWRTCRTWRPACSAPCC